MSAQPAEDRDGCQACSAPTDMYLCSRCVGTLRDMFTALVRGPFIDTRATPGLLEHLGEAALGQVRMETGGGRRTRRAGLVQYTDPKPAADGLGGTEGQRRLEQDAEAGKLSRGSVLRQGGINPKATRLLTETHTVLVDCVETLASYGVTPPTHFAAIPRASIPASFQLAEWLTGQMAAFGVIDKAGAIYDDIDRLTRRIEKLIDRPEPLRTCGPCPTLVDRKECGTELTVKHDECEVTCPACKQTHNVDRLIADLYKQSDDMLMTVRELVDWVLPKLEEHVPQKTLEAWINRGWIPLRGHNDSGAQMVRLGDVRECRRNRPRHKRAG